MSPDLFAQAWRSGTRSMLARVLVILLLLGLCGGGVWLLLQDRGAGWNKIGEVLLQAGLLGSGIVMLALIVAGTDGPKAVTRLRTKLLKRIQLSAEQMTAEMIQPARKTLFDYSSEERGWHALSQQQRQACLRQWRFTRELRTLAFHLDTLKPGVDHVGSAVIVSMWLYGRSAHVGVFVHQSAVDRVLGTGEAEGLLNDICGYFLCPKADLNRVERGAYVLIDHVTQSEHLLVDQHLQDALEVEFCHVARNLVISLEGLMSGRAKPGPATRP